MPILLLLAVAAAPAASPPCQSLQLHPTLGRGAALVHPLDQEPPAKAVRTVLRSQDHCSRPVLVSERDHGRPAAPR